MATTALRLLYCWRDTRCDDAWRLKVRGDRFTLGGPKTFMCRMHSGHHQEPPKAELLQCLVTVSGLPCDDLPVGGLDATPPPHQTVHHVCCEGLARACLTGLEDVYRLTKGRHFVEEVRICAHVEQLATVLEYQRELPSQDVPPRLPTRGGEECLDRRSSGDETQANPFLRDFLKGEESALTKSS